MEPRDCNNCHEPFKPTHHRQRYCDDECQQDAQSARRGTRQSAEYADRILDGIAAVDQKRGQGGSDGE